MPIDFSKFSRNAATATAERMAAAQSVDTGGTSTWTSVLDVARAPISVKWWKPTEGTHVIDILPVKVRLPQNPDVLARKIGLDEYDFGLNIWTHPDAKGGNGTPHVCLKSNWNRKCPRCDEYFRPVEEGGTFIRGVQGTGNAAHRRSLRTFFAIVPREAPQVPGDELFLWDAPHESFTKELLSEATACGDAGRPVFFWWPTDEGRTVEFRAVPAKMKNAFDFKGFKFRDRPAAVGQALMERFTAGGTLSLDALLKIPTAQEMEADIYGAPKEEQEAPARQPHTLPAEDGNWAAREYKREEADVPPSAPPHTAPVPAYPDKVPSAPSTPAPSGGKCPSGLVYGESYMDTPEPAACRTCAVYDACVDGK